IKNFEPEEYWSITGEFEKAKKKFEAQYYGSATEKMKLQNEEDVKAVMASMKDKKFTVNRVVKKERKRNPSPSFTTSSLQQEAARKLNFRAKKTMMLAQQLYEGISVGKEGITGLITYMRTDSTRISDTAKLDTIKYIEEKYGSDYVTKAAAAKQGAKSQDAHEAVRPTSVLRTPASLKSSLSRDLYRCYQLIGDRFVASQMSPAILDTVMAELQNGEAVFRANGSQVKFPGFTKVYVEGTDDQKEEKDNILPEMDEGDIVTALEVTPNQHFTQPPPRFTEARLVRTLEELGIGRPSTYAPTLDTIQKRGYVTLDAKRFIPTELGEIVHQLVLEFFPDILNIEFTAKMEHDLDTVEDGEVDWRAIIDAFYQDFEKSVE